ncbi:putative reverse transcriptase domain-containing protein [Tanacetum coccineum]|uniref:Reverse transcriptase domain-containing protein n=1 Tax=Tanacetum coccineum TaxID=301880 RepID=A0ABQ5F5D0_9ASTR
MIIAYASLTTQAPHDENYTTHDLELGAVAFALKIWRHYLYGIKCTVFTDHKILQHILDQKELNMRQRRWLELLADHDCEIRYHPGEGNVVADALNRKERIKPLKVRALVMTLHPKLPHKSSSLKRRIKRRKHQKLRTMRNGQKHLKSPNKSANLHPLEAIDSMETLTKFIYKEISLRHGMPISIISNSTVVVSSAGDFIFRGSHNASTRKRRLCENKGVIRFGKRGKLNPRYIGPFKILKRVGPMAYTLELPEELSSVHSTFHVYNLKKCLSDESLVFPMKELRLDDTLNFMEEPVEIMDREVKQLSPKL